MKLGIIGLGQAAALIVGAIRTTPNLPWQLVAGADPRAHAREQFAAEFGEGYPDAEALCRESTVDAVYVSSPSWMHLDHVRAAARYGKHVICEKPLALSVADALTMLELCRDAGVVLLAGHTHSFDAPIQRMAALVASGEVGPLRSINSWNFNEFNHRPRLHAELVATHGPVLNQGPHQVDVVRQIAASPVRSVRGTTIPDGVTGVEGGYTAYLEFEGGVPATLVYDGRSLFDSAELFEWVAEGGAMREPDTNAIRRRAFEELATKSEAERDAILAGGKEDGRYAGAKAGQLANRDPVNRVHQPFFGLTVVACEQATLRQSMDGLYRYSRDGREELAVERKAGGRIAELLELHEAILTKQRPFHDGAWGLATLEVCFAILESAATGRDVLLKHQVEEAHPMFRDKLVIDVHGHMSTPALFRAYAYNLIALRGAEGKLAITDEQLAPPIERHLRLLDSHRIDVQMISPRPVAMMHFEQPFLVDIWTRETNDLIAHQCELHPTRFLGIAQLNQSAYGTPGDCVPELERCIVELGFVGALLNPDPGGDRQAPGMNDPAWFPLYKKAEELQATLIVHPSISRDRRLAGLPHSYQYNFLTEETLATLLLEHSDVFDRYPNLRIVICHCGGALRRLHEMGEPADAVAQAHGVETRIRSSGEVRGGSANPTSAEGGGDALKDVANNLFFDTCAYDTHFLATALKQRGVARMVFGTEVPGSGTNAFNPMLNAASDDVVTTLESYDFLTDEDRLAIVHHNPLRVFPLAGDKVKR